MKKGNSMGIFLFFTFFVSDLIVIIACGYENKKYHQYRDGMILGVHIPAEAVDDAEVQTICQKAARWNKNFQRMNHILNILVCGFCWYWMELGILLWVVWIVEYLVGLELVLNVPHKNLYRLKVRNQWISEKTKHLVYIDTTAAAQVRREAFSWKWHLLPGAAVMVTGIWLWRSENWFMKENVGISLFGVSVGISLLFLILHLWIVEGRNTVYSQNSEINVAVNQMIKRSWSAGLLGASFFNLLAWLFLVWRMAGNEWVDNQQYILYTVLQLIGSAVFLFPVLRMQSKKNEILENDSEEIYVDDDEYWKDGNYNNPDDRRILVPGRVSTASYTFNMGRPAGKIIYGGILVITAGAFIWMAAVMIPLINLQVDFQVKDQKIRFSGGGYECEFTVDEVLGAELVEALPDDRFSKINGGATKRYNVGHFKGKETGKTMMFLYEGYEPILKIELSEMTVFVNSREAGKAELWYEALSEIMR